MLSLNKKTGHELLYYSYQVSNVFSLLHTHIFPLSVYIVPIFYFILTVYTLYTGYSVTPVYNCLDKIRRLRSTSTGIF